MAEYPLMKYWEAPDGTVYEVCDEEARNKGIDQEQLSEAVNTALAQAKESGEFDGAPGDKGDPGTPGKDGANGKDGVSPSVTVSKSGKVTTIKITDAAGTKTATVNDGADGKDGSTGAAGKDGVSPTVAVSTITGGNRVTVTDANGSHSFDVMNGKDGQNGEDGYTPVKGTDYFDGAPGSPGKDGKDGTSVTVASVSESAEDGGTNTVTFSDGKKLNVRNGGKGSDGAPGKDGSDANVTAANIKSALGYNPADAEDVSRLSAEKENKLDAAAYGLPILKLTGDVSAMTKENAVSLAYEYGEMSGTASVKWQGGSSLNYPKKNYTINFDQAFEAAEGWGAQKKYCLKANYIDFTHARNVVSARLWGQIVKSRKSVNTTLAASPNYGAVNGFPCVITLNGVFHGVYTFNIPKDKWMANMGSGTNECILCADSHVDATRFKAAATLNGDFDLEYVTDENNSGWVTTSLNSLIYACISTRGEDLDTTIAAKLDWESAIDYYIFTVLLRGDDMTDKNYLLLTYDGTKWIFGGYDMDSTYGLHWNGKQFLAASDTTTFATYAGLHRLMYLIRKYKMEALKARYAELRETVLSEDNVAKEFLNFVCQIPRPLLEEDNRTWPLIPSTNANSVQQILNWYRLRCAAIDEEVRVMTELEDKVGNLVPTALDYASDGIYNEVGYKNNSRWSSAEPHVRDWDGYVTTGLIQLDFPKTMAEATEDKYIYIKGCDGGAPFGDTDTNLSAIILWNPDKTYNGIANINNSKKCFNVEQLGEDYYRLTYKAGSDGIKTQFYGSFGYNLSDGSYFALGLKGSGDNMIVTIGEPIE